MIQTGDLVRIGKGTKVYLVWQTFVSADGVRTHHLEPGHHRHPDGATRVPGVSHCFRESRLTKVGP